MTADRSQGSPDFRDPEIARFWSKVRVGASHWLWQGYLSRGYGSFWSGSRGRHVGAHRYAYELVKGPIPEGLSIDHLCRVRNCVNPSHLEAVSTRVNLIRGEGFPGVESRLTNCPKGHPYSGDNLRIKNGQRICRTCHREEVRAWRAKHPELLREQKRREWQARKARQWAST